MVNSRKLGGEHISLGSFFEWGKERRMPGLDAGRCLLFRKELYEKPD